MAFKPVVFFSFVLLLAVNVSTGHDELLKEIGAEALPLAYAFCASPMPPGMLSYSSSVGLSVSGLFT